MLVRPSFRLLLFVLSTSCAWAQGATGDLLLPAGTAVLVHTEERLLGDEVHEGQQVKLSTRGLVQNGREIVIPFRVVGKATVRQVHGTGLLGAWKRFSISLEDIEAADGTRIELDHSPIPVINGPQQTPIQKRFSSGPQKWGISGMGETWLLAHTKSDVRFPNPDSFPAPKPCSSAEIGVYALFRGFSHVEVTISSKSAKASAPETGREALPHLRNVKFGAGEQDVFEVPPGELTVQIADQQFDVNLAPCAGVYYRVSRRDGRLQIESVPEEIFVIEAQFVAIRGTTVGIISPRPL